jgi:hypothetical protein
MPRVTSKLGIVAIASAVLIIHYVSEFFAWARYPGNTAMAIHGGHETLAWNILSFPLFYILNRSTGTGYFDMLLIANSAIWSCCLTWFITLLVRKI